MSKTHKKQYNKKTYKYYILIISIIIIVCVLIKIIISNNSKKDIDKIQETTTNSTEHIDNTSIDNSSSSIEILYDAPGFVTNSIEDVSVFVKTQENSDYNVGLFKIINSKDDLTNFIQNSNIDFHKEELYKISRYNDNNFKKYYLVAYIDSYETNSVDRDADTLSFQNETFTLNFNKNIDSNLGDGYWIYFVFVDKVALGTTQLKDYPIEFNIQ